MKQLNMGIAGLGRLGMEHARNIAWHIPGCKLKAICAKTEKTLDAGKELFGEVAAYTSFDEMLKNDEIQAVAIVSPSGLHCEQIEKALDAGKHVFCEKPLGVSAEQCLQAEKAARQHPGLVCMLGFMRRYDPSYIYAKQKILSGQIGTPYLFKGTAMDPESAIEGCIRYSDSSSGIFLDLAVHDIDLIRWYLGSEIAEVHAMGTTFKYPQLRAKGDDETGIAVFRMENGALAMLHVGRSAPHGYHIETEILGTKGSVRISPVPEKNLAMLYTGQGVVKECIEDFPQRFAQAYLEEMREFVSCVLEGRKPSVTLHDGTMSAVAALATKQSWQTGEIVKLSYPAFD